MRSSWILGALASSVLTAGACGHSAMREEAELGHVPMEQKQEVFTAQHNESVAQANLAAAEQARDQARAFASIASDEAKTAESRLSVANRAVSMGRDSGMRNNVHAGNEEARLAEHEIAAARAKTEFATHLVALRQAEVQLAERRLDAAHTELRIAKLEVLGRAGMSVPEDIAKPRSDLARTNDQIARIQRDIGTEHAEVESMKVAWDTARRSFNVAARETPVTPPIEAPGPAPRIPQAPLPEPNASPEGAPQPSGQ